MAKRIIGLDIETHDPLLKIAGYSWKYNQGYILATALYYADKDKLVVIPGIHNDNCPIDKQTREEDNRMCIEMLLRNPDVILVGANLMYDIGWLLYEYGMSTYEVKCSFIDILQAEAILDEFGTHSLESLSHRYLKIGKAKAEIEAWVRENKSKKGDFRKYLKDAPYHLLEGYVKIDAKNPCLIWKKQLTLLKAQDLCKRAKMEFDCILPSLQMTMNGIPFDVEQKKKNLAFLTPLIKKFHEEFVARYNLPKFRITANNDIASFLDMRGVPYKCKITLKGENEVKFRNGEETDKAYMRAKRIVSQFRLQKGEPVAYIPKELADRTCELLKEEGFMFNCSPNVDKKFREAKREAYPEVALIDDWKRAVGIESKMLGTKYDRFVTTNDKGETCIKPQFKITDTTSFRYSSTNPNGQQIPSKGGFTVHEGEKEIEVSFPKITRALCTASKGCVFGKIDYGQIEYRLICNIACGEAGKEVRRQYAENPHMDFHQYVVDLTGLSRKYAKNMSFGCFERNSYYLSGKGWRKIQHTIDTGVMDLSGEGQFASYSFFKDKGLKFTLSNGVQFTVNPEHEFLDCTRAEEKIYTKKATAMKVGDRLPLTLLHHGGSDTMTESQAYLAGLYLGDGCGCKTSIGLISHKENRSKVESCLKSCNFTYSVREESKVVRFTVHKESKDFFHSFGTRTANKHLTDEIYESGERVQLAFLAGMLDSDGSVTKDSIRFMGTNEKLLRQIALLCAMLGFDSGFNTCDRKNGKSTGYTVLVYNTNKHCIPSAYRNFNKFQQSKTDTCGWVLNREDTLLKKEQESKPLYKENPKLYDYLIRTDGNIFVHNSFMPEGCWQKNYIPVKVMKIEEVKETEFVCLSTESNYYNAMGVATHNCSFGMGLPSMAENFGWTMEHAEEIAEAYHTHMPFVAPTLALVGDVAKERGYIKTVYGSHARLLDKKKAYTMLNRYTQGSGAECLKMAIIQAYKEGLWEKLKVSNTVHDELNMPYLEPTEEKMLALYRMAEIMRTAMPGLRVPLEAEIELGDNWASTKEIKDWVKIRENDKEAWEKTSPELKKAVAICERLIKKGRVQSA